MTEQTQPQIDPNTPIQLTLPVGAINMVLQALAKQPYEQSAPLIDEIRKQATIELAKETAVTDVTDNTQTGEQA